MASTKAFTTQLVALFLLTLVLAKYRGKLAAKGEEAALRNLRHLPAAVQSVLALEPQIISWAEAVRAARSTRCSSAAVGTIRSRSRARSSSRRSATSTPRPTPPAS